MQPLFALLYMSNQGGITCGGIDEPRKSSKAIDECVIIDFCDKNVIIARFRDKNGFLSYSYIMYMYLYESFATVGEIRV